jgi:hypothetical protein
MAIDLTGGQPVERDYVFAERPGPEVRDAVNFWVEEVNGAFAMRIGVEAVAEEWDAHEICSMSLSPMAASSARVTASSPARRSAPMVSRLSWVAARSRCVVSSLSVTGEPALPSTLLPI